MSGCVLFYTTKERNTEKVKGWVRSSFFGSEIDKQVLVCDGIYKRLRFG